MHLPPAVPASRVPWGALAEDEGDVFLSFLENIGVQGVLRVTHPQQGQVDVVEKPAWNPMQPLAPDLERAVTAVRGRLFPEGVEVGAVQFLKEARPDHVTEQIDRLRVLLQQRQ